MRPLVVAIVNVTPDSFSDGGLRDTTEKAIAYGLRVVQEGADAVDVGGESTRPGSEPVPEDVEAARVLPVVAGLRRAGVTVPISVDTRKAAVADAAIRAGATVVNDISAGTADPDMLATAARHGAGVVLMHMQGEPKTMQNEPRYGDVVKEVTAFLAERAAAAERAGIPRPKVWVDPGIGFGKTFAHNETLMAGLERLIGLGFPLLVGASRKGFLGAITGRPVGDRLAASLACVARCRDAGVHAVRVHDVSATVDLLKVLDRVSPAR